MTDTLRLIALCSAVWVVLALIYGWLAHRDGEIKGRLRGYRDGYNRGQIDGMNIASRSINRIGREK